MKTQWAEFGCEEETALVVDALLGTGFTRPVEGLYRAVIESLPECFPDATVLAVDIPSGLSADSGKSIGCCGPGRSHGDVHRAEAMPGVSARTQVSPATSSSRTSGILPSLVLAPEHNLNLITPDLFPEALHRRREDTHKGDYGKVLIVGGSRGKSGAAAMAGQAALRSGAGLVTVATPSSCLPIVAASMPELMTEPLEETSAGTIANASIAKLLEGKTVLGIGPGLGADPRNAGIGSRSLSVRRRCRL